MVARTIKSCEHFLSAVDWCYVEALGTEKALKYSKNINSEEDFNSMPDETDLLKMRECSPIIHVKKVTAPVLMLIGAKDRRVPMSQGVAYYHNLKAKGTAREPFQNSQPILFFHIDRYTDQLLTPPFSRYSSSRCDD